MVLSTSSPAHASWHVTMLRKLVCLQAQAAALRRVGQGGLDEAAGEGPSVAASDAGNGQTRGRHGDVVAGSDLLRQPCQADDAIRTLAQQLRGLKNARQPLSSAQGAPQCLALMQASSC